MLAASFWLYCWLFVGLEIGMCFFVRGGRAKVIWCFFTENSARLLCGLVKNRKFLRLHAKFMAVITCLFYASGKLKRTLLARITLM